MFKENDRVVVVHTGAKGTIVYAEDGYYTVELDNGAEQDFENASSLVLETNYVAATEVETHTLQQALRVLKSVNTAHGSFYRMFEQSVIASGVDFDGLTPIEQVKALAKLTKVDVEEFYDSSHNDKDMRKLLQIISEG